jgi:class 3 adenylate cyclase
VAAGDPGVSTIVGRPETGSAAPGSSLVTMAFTDIVGSTELLGLLGARADDVRRTLFAAMRAAVDAGGGHEVKNLGDGLMLVFPSATQAVSCAVELQRAVARVDRRERGVSLQIRVGVSVGEATCEEDDFFGPPVVEAARLCSSADGGQILVSDLVRSLVGSRARHGFRSVGRLDLKGLGEPVAASEVEWRPTTPDVPLPPAVADSNRSLLVGRGDATDVISRALERAVDGERQCVLVAGEPGIGKTRLAAAAAATAHAAGATALYGRCDAELSVAYQPFAQALRHYVTHVGVPSLQDYVAPQGRDLQRLVPEIRDRLPELGMPVVGDPEADRLRLFEAVDGVLAGASQDAPLVLVLDDLHWAPRPTLLLLSHLARSAEPAALLIVATFRTTELEATRSLTESLGELRRQGNVERLDLGGLDEAAVAAFLQAWEHRRGPVASELVHLLHSETGGNPFFVGELVRHLAEMHDLSAHGVTRARLNLEIPGRVRDVIRARIARLSPATGRVLESAAVLGDEFDLDLLQSVHASESHDDAVDGLDEAVRARILLEGNEDACRYRFAHSLVRATIYGDLTAARRASLHRRAGEALEQWDARTGGDDLASLAHHFCEASKVGARDKAADYALRAAQRAMEQVAYEQAAAILERGLVAVGSGRPTDLARRCDLLLALAETRVRSLDFSGTRAASLQAAAAARAARSPERLAQAAYWYGARAVAGTRDEVGIKLCQEALDGLGPDTPPAQRGRVLAVLALQQSLAGAAGAAEAVADEALALARLTSDADALGLALFARYYSLWGSARSAEQIMVAEQLLDSPLVTPMGWAASTDAHRLLAVPHLSLGDLAGFLARARTVEEMGRALKSRYFLGLTALWKGCHALLEGRYRDVDALLASPDVSGVDDPNLRNAFAGQLFQLASERGTLADLKPLIADAIDRTPGLAGFRAALALTHAELGEPDLARAVFEEIAADDFRDVPHDLVRPAALSLLAEVSARLGDAERAATLYTLLEPYGGQLVVVASGAYCPGAADRYLGILATVDRRRSAAAEPHFRAALALETAIGAHPLAARTRYWYGRSLLAAGSPGDRERAKVLLHESADVAGRLGMAGLAAAIEAVGG